MLLVTVLVVTIKYVLDLAGTIVGVMFSEDGERGDHRRRALRITVLSHDVAYSRSAACSTEKEWHLPNTSAGLRYSSH